MNRSCQRVNSSRFWISPQALNFILTVFYHWPCVVCCSYFNKPRWLLGSFYSAIDICIAIDPFNPPALSDRMLDHPTPPSSASRIKASQVENAFPTPPRPDDSDSSSRINGRLSPAPGKFMNLQRAQSTPPNLTDDSCFRSLTRGTVGDLPDARNLEQTWSRLHLSKKKSQYYNDAFAYRETNNSARERVARDSVILAEVKLNFCVSSFPLPTAWADARIARIGTRIPHRPVLSFVRDLPTPGFMHHGHGQY